MSMLEQGYSARYIIFNKLFSVKVRNVESLSKEYILTYELPYTGDKKTDNEFANQIVEKYVTIAQMAEWHYGNVAMAFPYLNEIIEMYEVIRQHIKDFRVYVNSSININTVPMEDLDKLSNFASALFKFIPNKEKYIEKVDVDILGLSDNSMDMFDVSKIFRPVSKKTELKEDQEQTKHYYSSDYTIPEQEKGPHVEDMDDIKNKTQYRRQDWLTIGKR